MTPTQNRWQAEVKIRAPPFDSRKWEGRFVEGQLVFTAHAHGATQIVNSYEM